MNLFYALTCCVLASLCAVWAFYYGMAEETEYRERLWAERCEKFEQIPEYRGYCR